MAAKTPQNAIRRIDFNVIGDCQWQIDEAKDAGGKAILKPPPDGRPYELLFYLACRPEMQATRQEIMVGLWGQNEKETDHDTTLKTWLTQLNGGKNLPGGEAWQRSFPMETTPDFVRLKEGCTSDMQEFWNLREEARRENAARTKKAQINRMREIERQQLMPRPLWRWVLPLRKEMREEIEALEKTLPVPLPPEDLPHAGEFPGNLTYPRNPYFTGREEILDLLSQRMKKGEGTIQALPGLGGMGKTETAVEFAYRCFDKQTYPDYPIYNRVLWSRADDVDALRNGYATIARALPDFPFRDETDINIVVPAVVRWLADPKQRGWLLILDNADDTDLLWDFLPRLPDRRQGQVLLPSRSQTFQRDIHPIVMEPMPTDEAAAFFFHRTGRDRAESTDEEQWASKLAEALGGLPLALEQAAAYLQKHPSLRFADYLALYRNRRKELLTFHAEARPYQTYNTETGHYEEYLTVWTTWDLNFRQIAECFPRSAELLRLSALLSPAPIPCEIVYEVFQHDLSNASEAECAEYYARLLEPLHNHSLVKILRSQRAFSVHQIVQTVLRDRPQPEDRKQAYERILSTLARSFPSEDYVVDGRGALFYPHAEHLRAYAHQTGIEGETVGLLLSHMGFFLYSQGRFAEAEPILKHALEIRRKVSSEAHSDIAQSLNDLALLYQAQGRIAEAEPLFLQALEMRQKVLPEGHADIAQSLNNLAALYQTTRFDEAERLYLQALELEQKGLPAGHLDIASSLNNLGVLYYNQGRFAEAEPRFLQALAIRKQGLPENHPILATSLNNLAAFYQSQSRFDEAESLYIQALEMRQKGLPAGHLDIASCLNNLALIYRIKERFDEAEPLLKQALEMRQKGLPAGHFDIAVSINNLAALYKSWHRLDKAEPLYQQALEIWRKALPEGHPVLATSLNNLGELYRGQRRFAEAEPLYQQATGILLSTLGTEHPNYQATFRRYLTCLMEMGKEAQVQSIDADFPALYRANRKKEG